jgi:hypothetical protein
MTSSDFILSSGMQEKSSPTGKDFSRLRQTVVVLKGVFYFVNQKYWSEQLKSV